jgi:pyruvate carboxylase subunit B
MPGTVIDVLVSEGQAVQAGDPVLVIEAMKMESEIPAPIRGTVKAVNVSKGQAANPDDALIEIEP